MSDIESPSKERLWWLIEHFTPWAQRFFKRYPHRRSLLLACAQYWNDEASDAVHDVVAVSNHDVPSWPLGEGSEDLAYEDTEAGALSQLDAFVSGWSMPPDVGVMPWGDNQGAVRPFQAMCGELGSQELSWEQQYVPCVLAQRVGEGVKVTIVGEVMRPWLDLPSTPLPSWSDEDGSTLPPQPDGAELPEADLPFYDAIAAHPFDDAPRRVLADHLQERGDALADFMVPREPTAAQLHAHGEQALGELVACVPLGSARFVHGSLASCTVSFDEATSWVAYSPRWRTVHTLRLCFQGQSILSDEMKALRHLAGVSTSGLMALEGWSGCPRLQTLSVLVSGPKDLQRLCALPLHALERLTVIAELSLLKAFVRPPSWAALRELRLLTTWQVNDEGETPNVAALKDFAVDVPVLAVGTSGELAFDEGYRVAVDRAQPTVARVFHERLGPASAPSGLQALLVGLPAAVRTLELVPSPVWRAEPFASTRFQVTRG